jgi:hypothetical protein
MSLKPPTTTQIHELAERRTAGLGYPKDPPTDGRNLDLWREQRSELLDRQIVNAKIELTRRYEQERDREAAETARLRDQADAREADLRRRFDTRFPGGSDADYQTMRSTLMAELSSEATQSEKAAYAESRRRIRF